MELKDNAATQETIGPAFETHHALGYEVLKKVDQRALQVEVARRGLRAELAIPEVRHKGAVVGEYAARPLRGS